MKVECCRHLPGPQRPWWWEEGHRNPAEWVLLPASHILLVSLICLAGTSSRCAAFPAHSWRAAHTPARCCQLSRCQVLQPVAAAAEARCCDYCSSGAGVGFLGAVRVRLMIMRAWHAWLGSFVPAWPSRVGLLSGAGLGRPGRALGRQSSQSATCTECIPLSLQGAQGVVCKTGLSISQNGAGPASRVCSCQRTQFYGTFCQVTLRATVPGGPGPPVALLETC